MENLIHQHSNSSSLLKEGPSPFQSDLMDGTRLTVLCSRILESGLLADQKLVHSLSLVNLDENAAAALESLPPPPKDAPRATDGVTLTAQSGSVVIAEKGSTVIAEKGSRVYANDGSSVKAKSGSLIEVSGAVDVVTQPGADILLRDGAVVAAAKGPCVHMEFDVKIEAYGKGIKVFKGGAN
ncbi:MAG: hypothetical protein K2X27_18985 [Candidatus Obscuribacterales bacterium]|nr:hypothetical protein [Candidatus Obscuribacterales bacterium]